MLRVGTSSAIKKAYGAMPILAYRPFDPELFGQDISAYQVLLL